MTSFKINFFFTMMKYIETSQKYKNDFYVQNTAKIVDKKESSFNHTAESPHVIINHLTKVDGAWTVVSVSPRRAIYMTIASLGAYILLVDIAGFILHMRHFELF